MLSVVDSVCKVASADGAIMPAGNPGAMRSWSRLPGRSIGSGIALFRAGAEKADDEKNRKAANTKKNFILFDRMEIIVLETSFATDKI